MAKQKALLVAEKKSVADDIKKVYEKIKSSYPYEIDFAYCAGHLVGLCLPDEYKDKGWDKWNKEQLPLVPDVWQKKVIPSKASFLKTLKQLYKDGNYDVIINAGDAGREGQLIQTWVYEEIGVTCPVYRYWADDTTAYTIEKALNNLVPNENYKGLTDASVLRAYLDWMCGMNYSRAGSISLDRKISVGRVMTPTLAMIVNRETEIQNFVPEKYFEMEALFSFSKGEYKGMLLNPKPMEKYPYRFNDREFLEKVGVLKNGTITKVEQEEKLSYAPYLYNLTDLQKECASSKMKLAPKKTLDIAEALYLKHLISYPRTESKCLSSAQKGDVQRMLSAVSSISEVSEIASSITKADIDRAMGSKKYCDDKKVSDHPALTPTGETADLSKLSSQELTVYMMIVKRFLAIFLPPKKTLATTIITESNGYSFKSTGSVILNKGYTILYGEEKVSEPVLPNISEGETVSVKNTEILEKETTPPKRYTQATILAAMETAGKTLNDEDLEKVLKECAGLGTPATRADILNKLMEDEYVKNLQNNLVPTQAGIDLINALSGQQIVSVELTANWEKILKCVERGQFPYEVIYQKMIESVTQNTAQLLSLEPLGKLERSVVCQCPRCKKNVYESKNRYFCEGVLQEENPCDFSLAKSIGGNMITVTEFKKMCEGGNSKEYKFTWADKKTSNSRLCISGSEYKFVRNVVGKCPKCGRNVLVSGNSFYCEGATKANNGVCDFSMYNKIGLTKIPESVAGEVFENGVSSKTLTVKFKSGKSNRGFITINAEQPQFFALKIDKVPAEEICPCPYCKKGNIMHDRRFYVCSNNVEGSSDSCDFKIWDTCFDSVVSSEDMKGLLKNEKVALSFLSKDKSYSYKKDVSLIFNEEKSRYEYSVKKQGQ